MKDFANVTLRLKADWDLENMETSQIDMNNDKYVRLKYQNYNVPCILLLV